MCLSAPPVYLPQRPLLNYELFYGAQQFLRPYMNTAVQEKLFSSLLSRPENKHCADCSSKSPTWASIDFGVFVCLNCSGAHRALGPSVTRVRSTKLDTWQNGWSELLVLGNDKCNRYWEGAIGKARKPTGMSTLEQIKRFVQEKYMKKRFVTAGEANPVSSLKDRLASGERFQQQEEAPQEKPKKEVPELAPKKEVEKFAQAKNKPSSEDIFLFQDPRTAPQPQELVTPCAVGGGIDLLNFDEHPSPVAEQPHILQALYNQPQGQSAAQHPHGHILQHHNPYRQASFQYAPHFQAHMYSAYSQQQYFAPVYGGMQF